MTKDILDKQEEILKKSIPIGRVGSPTEVASLVTF